MTIALLTLLAADALPFLDRPIAFPPEREALTLDYIRQHYDDKATTIDIRPVMIVLHYTANGSLEGLYGIFNPTKLAGRPELLAAGAVNVSSQFATDRDGQAYRLMPETKMARHVVGLNRHAIGVENVARNAGELTAAQIEANVKLVRWLKAKYPAIRYLIGHHEYLAFRQSPLWEEKDPGYFTKKGDPGDAFMQAVRQRVADLGQRQWPARLEEQRQQVGDPLERVGHG